MQKWLLAVATLCMVAFSGLPAWAIEDCDSLVIDDSAKGVLGSGLGEVKAAANKLVAEGAQVRVRVIEDYSPSPDLKTYVTSILNQCRSWQDGNGGMKRTLVILANEQKHHATSVFFGEMWTKAFADGGHIAVAKTSMNPLFKTGDFVGGFVAGIANVRTRIDHQLAPATVTVSSGPTTVINQAATDYSSVSHTFLIIFLLALLFVAVVLVLVMLSRRKTNREAQKTAQLKAATARTECANAINGFDLTILAAKVNQVAASLSDEDANELRSLLTEIKNLGEGASADFSRLSGVATNNPDAQGLPTSAYAAIESSFRTVSEKLSGVGTLTKNLEGRITEHSEAGKLAPQQIDAANAAIDQASAGIDTIRQQGYKTNDAETIESEAEELLRQAREKLGEKRASAAASLAKKAEKQAKAALAKANTLPGKKSGIETSISELATRISKAGQRVTDTKPVFLEITATYAASSWQSIAGNGTEAGNRVSLATQALTDAQKSASMDAQDWGTSEKNVVTANGLLDEADGFLNAVHSLGANLADAKQKAKPEIDAAEADINKASSFLNEHESDVSEQLRLDLKRAKELLELARSALKQDKPDYVAIVKHALEANHAADEILEAANSQYENLLRKRQQARSLMEEAARSIKEAADYISNRSHVKEAARRELETARRAYADAERTTNLDQQLALGKEADENADSALTKAKRNVRDHARRQEERRDERVNRADDSSGNDLLTGVLVGAALSTIGGSSDEGRSSRSSRSDRDDNSGGGLGSIVAAVVDNSGGGDDTSYTPDRTPSPTGGGDDSNY